MEAWRYEKRLHNIRECEPSRKEQESEEGKEMCWKQAEATLPCAIPLPSTIGRDNGEGKDHGTRGRVGRWGYGGYEVPYYYPNNSPKLPYFHRWGTVVTL
eukprot:766055-Hanusia_phi.AAC.17